jgi:hypothetical protein
VPRCFREPIPELYQCAAMLRQAASAHLSGLTKEAEQLLRESNSAAVRQWLDSIWGKSSPYVQVRSVHDAPGNLSTSGRVESRMPTSQGKRLLLKRDGFHCRFCGLPLIRQEVRSHLHRCYPDALPWGRTNLSQHAAFQALWVQYDHILPHARGGSNDLQNMVIACAACNFGRMNYTLEEVGIADPRLHSPFESDWNGLEDVLPETRQIIL